jgi:integrase
MPRPATGQVIEKTTQRGTVYALRFRAYGQRRYVTLGTRDDGWDHKRAETELRHVLADVERGTWQPADSAPVVEVEQANPTFHTFASEWFASVEGDLRESTRLDYRWQLVNHLLPFFADHTLRQIDVREVDRYRDSKVGEAERRRSELAAWQRRCDALQDGAQRPPRPAASLSAESINKTLTRLGQILERALEYGMIDRNPVRIGRRKLRTSKAGHSYLDDAAQVADLLAAAAELDAESRPDRRHIPRRAIVATLAFTGLRIGEALALRWRNVDLAGARLRIDDAKTAAGVRHVTIHPALIDELRTLKANAAHTAAKDPVFATRAGTPLSDDNVRSRVFAKAVDRANARRVGEGLGPLPESLTPHSLRRTYISALLALGWEVPVVMAEVGHSDPKVTLGIYAQVMRRDKPSRERLAGLLEGRLSGTIGHWVVETMSHAAFDERPSSDETPADAGAPEHGRGGFRTCDLSRVKRALSH